MAVSNIKDDNINQAMQKAKSESVDAWAEYQSARVKLHIDENGLAQLRLLETAGNFDRALAACLAAKARSKLPAVSRSRSCARPFSSMCSLTRADWYSAQASTDSDLAFCMAWLMLSSLIFDTAMNTDSNGD